MRVKRSMFNELVTDKSKKILDLGCGSGPFLKYLASNGFHNLYGIEPDAALLEHVPPGVALDVKHCKAENIAFEDSYFDVVFVYGVLYLLKGLDSYKASCNEICRVLKPGGLLFVIEPGARMILKMRGAVRLLGMVSSTFKELSVILEENKENHVFFVKNHKFIKDYMKTEKDFKVIVDKYFLHSWFLTARKGIG